MQLTSVFLAAVAAMTVSAAPSTTSPSSVEAALGGHHAPRCHGNMEYDPWKKQCKCDRGEYYDVEAKQCRHKEVKTFKYKKCRADEKLYCARDEGTFVEYNRKNPACWQERSNKLFCAKKSRVKETFKSEVQREYEVAHYSAAQRQESETRRQACHAPRHFNHHRNSCECPHKKVWDGKHCGFPKIPEPTCRRGQKAYCAKSAYRVTQYSVKEELCQDNGKNYVFCCGEDVEEKKHKKTDKKPKTQKKKPAKKPEEKEEEEEEEEEDGEDNETNNEDDEEEEKEEKKPKKGPKKGFKKGSKKGSKKGPKKGLKGNKLNHKKFAKCAGLIWE